LVQRALTASRDTHLLRTDSFDVVRFQVAGIRTCDNCSIAG
jgi:hypothetical protein